VISTFHGIELLKRALFANEALINTTGHNISNANTPGYSRQQVQLTEYAPIFTPDGTRAVTAGQMGTGVDMTDITRVRNVFLDQQYRNNNSTLQQWTQIQTELNQIQAVFNEPSDTGISTVMSQFFNAWAQLGTPQSADDPSARSVVLQRAEELTNSFNSTSKNLQDIQTDILNGIQSDVQQVNTYLKQISDLTVQINNIESYSNDKANDLRDQRDEILDQLSKLTDVTATESTGTYTVTIGGQTVIDVQGTNAPTVTNLTADSNGQLSIPVTGGELKGYADSMANVVNYQSMLDTMVNTFVQGSAQVTLPNTYSFSSNTTTMPFDAVLPDGTKLNQGQPVPSSGSLPAGTIITVQGFNGLHQLGYTMTSPTNSAPPFFQTSDGSSTFTAANIKVNDSIVNDLRNIASSDQAETDSNGQLQVLHGNGDLAVMASNFGNSVLDFSQASANGITYPQGTVTGYYNAIIDQIGIQGQQADLNVNNQQALVNQVDNQRQSVSGVSIDEEMANMIKYQQSYNAAAKLISVLDQMYDTINGMVKS
jgi:flagellar hook-associated protein 1 FlgK